METSSAVIEVSLTPTPEVRAEIERFTASTGRSIDALIEDLLAERFKGLAEVRQTLNSRYDDIESGRVALIDGEEARARLRAKHWGDVALAG
jgi:hypothetical protein